MENSNPIPGCPGYRATGDGSIWSCWRTKGQGYGKPIKKIMSGFWKKLKGEPKKKDGRKRYTVRREDGTYRRSYGSHFVLESFVGPCPPGMEACHNDGDCKNDSVENLRWDTPESNKEDMVRHGTRVRGELINTAKLTEENVREIRRIGKPLKQHAERFKVTEALVSAIIKRKVWRHVD